MDRCDEVNSRFANAVTRRFKPTVTIVCYRTEGDCAKPKLNVVEKKRYWPLLITQLVLTYSCSVSFNFQTLKYFLFFCEYSVLCK
jgi:hypothetical protein